MERPGDGPMGVEACVVTEDTDDLENVFETNMEVVTYSSPRGCIEKLEQLLKKPDEARRIGQRAQERTLKDHTYRQRDRELTRQLDLPNMDWPRGS